MPVLPSEEEAPEGITEQVAKDPTRTESTASSHESHNQGLATAQDHQSKGPQIPINMSGMLPGEFGSSSVGMMGANGDRYATGGRQGGDETEGSAVEPRVEKLATRIYRCRVGRQSTKEYFLNTLELRLCIT